MKAVFKTVVPNKSIDLYVKNIMLFEKERNFYTSLPFFADGYPGLMFQQTEQRLVVYPYNKTMSTVFLYGQTLNPISLEIFGTYRIIVFQLYPFVLKSLFDILPNDIKDNCCDMTDFLKRIGTDFDSNLCNGMTTKELIESITEIIILLAERKTKRLDKNIVCAVKDIIESKGQKNIQSVILKTSLSSRTFERRFLAEIGLSAKHFAKIIQFQSSMKQLSSKEYIKLTDIVYQNGFADQSHFIRSIKTFTGRTPKYFKNR